MAANYVSSAGTIVDEVASLLRIDSIDRRVLMWVSLAYNDMIRRVPNSIFFTTSTVSVTASAEAAAISNSDTFGIPVAAIYVKATSAELYVPRMISMQDYNRMAHDVAGGSLQTSAVPTHFAIGPDTGSTGRSVLYTHPVPTSNFSATLIWTGRALTGQSATTDYLFLPYHFEQVLIWGAALEGAKMVRKNAYQLFASEYESALESMYTMLSYHPDTVPVRRSITGPYEGTPMMSRPPRFPSQIG